MKASSRLTPTCSRKPEEGLAADVLGAVLLSDASWPVRWPRERWEPLLFEETRNAGVELVSVLVGDCPFPPLLRRRNFIDATANRLAAMRHLKRWIWQWEQGATHSLNSTISADLEDLYAALSDDAGTLKTSGAEAAGSPRKPPRNLKLCSGFPAIAAAWRKSQATSEPNSASRSMAP